MVTDVSAETVHGGAERMLYHHLRALVDAGYEVTVKKGSEPFNLIILPL